MTCTTLVCDTPDGWQADCLTCMGQDGGPEDLGQYPTKRGADQAASHHRAQTKPIPCCPLCGRTMESHG